MSSRTDIIRGVRHAVVVTPKELESVFLQLSLFGSPTIKVACSDGSTIVCGSLEDLLRFDNYEFRRIKSITMEASSDGKGAIVDVQDDSFVLSRTGSISVTSEDDAKAFDMANKLQHLLAEQKPWYSFAARFNPILLSLAGCVLAMLVISVYDVLSRPYAMRPAVEPPGSYTILATFGVVVLMLLFSMFHVRLFPRVQFAIGKGIQRVQRLDGIRSILLVGVVLATAVGLATNALYDRVTSPSRSVEPIQRTS